MKSSLFTVAKNISKFWVRYNSNQLQFCFFIMSNVKVLLLSRAAADHHKSVAIHCLVIC